MNFRLSISAIAFLALAMTSCGGGNPMEQPEKREYTLAEAKAELASRPTIEEAMADYDRLLADFRKAITEVTGEEDWQSDDGSSAACTEFGQTDFDLDAESRSTRDWWAPGVSPEQWPAAWAAIKDLAVAAGFERTEVVRDEPDHHVLFIQGPHGAVLRVSSAVNWVLSIRSGCHRLGETPTSHTDPGTATS